MQVDHPVDLFFLSFSPGLPPGYQIFRKVPDTKKPCGMQGGKWR